MHDSANRHAEPLNREIVLTGKAESGDAVTGSIIWLHGLGADGNDFVPMVPALSRCQALPLRFIFPHAPIRPVTINGGMQMRAWYDIRSIDLTGERLLDQQGIEESISDVHRLIDLEQQSGIAADRVVIAGFSQGGVIALLTGLQLINQICGVVGLSCYLPNSTQLIDQPADSQKLPAFIAHGLHDPMVPFALGKQAAEQLGHQHYQVTWGEYPVDHGVHPDEITALDNWLYKLMQ